ncbi:Rhodanese-like domain-containing protein [Lipomyces oligophaga]|uniref:Rhodanese-like domain-containing protein n=1 Tax=Lipomyces oligophaga TaxID=45792 RepID=UPI0034CFD42B
MPVKVIDKHTLSSWMLSAPQSSATRPSSFAIVDVRDDDFIGGHIVSALHHPSSSFASNLPYLQKEVEQHPAVIFHCALSQQRGPTAAAMYTRYLEMTGDLQNSEKPQQEIYVLKGGFTEWQQDFGDDERLTADYDPTIWR